MKLAPKMQEHADRINVRVLGQFIEKYPDCIPEIKHEYEAAKRRLGLSAPSQGRR